MKKTIGMAFAVIIAALSVTACGEDEYGFQTVETARLQAVENAMVNVHAFRLENTDFAQYKVRKRGDSTISATCPQGDGWATMDLVHPTKKEVVKLKCSTVSAATGCLIETDFRERRYAKQDGKCNDHVPHPLPKVEA